MVGLLAVVVIFLGEGLMIASEAWAAQKAVEGFPVSVIVLPYAVMALSGAMLMLGYFYGVKVLGIWTTSVVSVLSVVILEPVIVFSLFRTLPNLNTALGFLLGAIGLIVTLRH